MSEKLNVTVIVKGARLSFPHLFEAQAADENSKPRYNCSLLLGGEKDPNVVEVKKAIDKVAKAMWPKGVPKKTSYCLRDQEDKAEKEIAGYEAGKFYISAARAVAQGRPLVVDRDKSPITAEDNKIYGGCYVNAKISIYAQTGKYGDKVNASLEVIQFVRDGDAFGGGKTSADDMPDVDENEDSGSEDALG